MLSIPLPFYYSALDQPGEKTPKPLGADGVRFDTDLERVMRTDGVLSNSSMIAQTGLSPVVKFVYFSYDLYSPVCFLIEGTFPECLNNTNNTNNIYSIYVQNLSETLEQCKEGFNLFLVFLCCTVTLNLHHCPCQSKGTTYQLYKCNNMNTLNVIFTVKLHY